MIIYDKSGLINVRVVEDATVSYNNGLITEGELLKIKAAYPSPFFTPNLFVRAGFFLLTCIISFFGSGLVALMFGSLMAESISIWLFVIALANYAMLELLVQQKQYYRAGVDDALTWISGGLFVAFLVSLINSSAADSDLTLSLCVCLIAAVFALRFTDWLAAVVACLAALACVFFTWQKMGDMGLLTMPFMLMFVSVTGYLLSKRYEGSTRYYKKSLLAAQVVSLLCLYASGNYYVIKELGDMLHGTVSKTIPFEAFFWLWTVTLPIVYIAFGIRQKSFLLIRTGLLLIAAAVYTFRNYYHVLPIEQALTLAGLILVGMAWWLVKYLEEPTRGFTSKPKAINREEGELNVESLVVADTFSEVGNHIEAPDIFGGGKFGGGGSSGDF